MTHTLLKTSGILDADEETYLLEAATAGDSHATERLVSANLGIIMSVARGMGNVTDDRQEDALSAGVEGFLQAIKHNHLRRGVRFWSFARFYVRGAIMTYMRENISVMTIPGERKRLSEGAQKAREDALRPYVLLSTPSRGEGGDDLTVTVGDLLEMRENDAPPGPERPLSDDLQDAMNTLTETQRLLISRRLGILGEPKMTDADQAESRGSSEAAVSGNIRKGLQRLRTVLS
jgi:DNA-directed RNA polymerase specialized sigma subunit